MPIVERPDMADYGVPEATEGTLPWSWAEERLVASKNFWLATASATGRPHSLPVWGVWLPDDEQFWFSCSPNARKARNLSENPQCVVTVDDTVECVSVEGRARFADVDGDAAAIDNMVDAYVRKYWGEPVEHPDEQAFVRSHAIVALTPHRAFGIIEREDEFARRATRWRW